MPGLGNKRLVLNLHWFILAYAYICKSGLEELLVYTPAVSSLPPLPSSSLLLPAFFFALFLLSWRQQGQRGLKVKAHQTHKPTIELDDA